MRPFMMIVAVGLLLSSVGISQAEEFNLFGSNEPAPSNLFCAPEVEVQAYAPPHYSAWTWPGFPDIEALRYHLLTEVPNHGDINQIKANRDAISIMTSEELQATHASDHEYLLDVSQVPNIPKEDAFVQFVSTSSTSTATDCPLGGCPTGVVRSATRVASGAVFSRTRAVFRNRPRLFGGRFCRGCR